MDLLFPLLSSGFHEPMVSTLRQVLDGVPQDEVKLNVIRSGVGPVTQSDVDAAATAGAPIFAFNVGVERPDVKVSYMPYL